VTIFSLAYSGMGESTVITIKMMHILQSCFYILHTPLLFVAPCATMVLSFGWKASNKIQGSLHSKEY